MVLKHWSLSPELFFQLEAALLVACPLLAALLTAQWLRVALRVQQQRSSGMQSGAPFVSLLATSFVWTLYGVMLRDPTLAYPSMFSVAAGVVCCSVFNMHATPESAFALYTTLYPAALVAVSTAIVLANLGHVQWLGAAGAVTSICSLLFSHVPVFQAVQRDKSTAALSYCSSILLWLSSLAWATYGLIIRGDSNIFIPNIISFVVATLQLHLFVFYGYSINTCNSSLFSDLLLPCSAMGLTKQKGKSLGKSRVDQI